MELFLLNLNALLRPIFLIEFGGDPQGGGTSELFNFFAMVMFAILSLAFLSNTALRRRVEMSVIDLVILALVVWCITAYLTYIDKANLRELIKFVFPLFCYVVAKNVVPDQASYRRMIGFMIVGFAVPMLWSAGLIAVGGGVEWVNEFTRIPRYQGVFPGAHQLAYGSTFLLMLLFLYRRLEKSGPGEDPSGRGQGRRGWEAVFGGLLGLTAMYCLVMSQVRTALIGFVVFLAYYLFVFNRRLLMLLSATSVVLVVVFSPTIYDTLFYDFKNVQIGEWEKEEIASGRPRIWRNNLEIFSTMPLDRQLAGVGIGNKGNFGGTEGITDSHNDYLDVLVQAGVLGFALYLALQVLLFRSILGIPGPERHVLLGIFVAVVLMNFSSNAFVTRSGNAQMFLLVMTYVELWRRRQAKL